MTNPEEAVVVTAASLAKRLRRGAEIHEADGDMGLPFILREAADMIDRLTAAPPVPQWRGIESAPRDGSNIILGRANKVMVGKWYDDNVSGFYSNDVGSDDISPDRPATHWMSLPAAPSADAAEVG